MAVVIFHRTVGPSAADKVFELSDTIGRHHVAVVSFVEIHDRVAYEVDDGNGVVGVVEEKSVAVETIGNFALAV